MFPGNGEFSGTPYPGRFQEPVNQRSEPLIDYEMGGVALQDPSVGLQEKLWTLRSDGHAVTVEAEGVAPVQLFARTGLVQRVSLAFDQQMVPHVAFVEDGVTWLWWWDNLAGAMTYTQIPGARSPCLGLDVKEAGDLASGDVTLAYMKGASVCIRKQRDRFAVEEVKGTASGMDLVSMGRNVGGRYQLMLQTPR